MRVLKTVFLVFLVLVATAEAGRLLQEAPVHPEGNVAPATPALGAPLPGRYIVVFAPSAGPAATAAPRLVSAVSAALAATTGTPARSSATTAATTAPPRLQLLRTIGAGAQQGDASRSTSAAAAQKTSSTGMQAVVLAAPEEALPHLRASSLVQAVFADQLVAAQQAHGGPASCVMPSDLAAGMTAAASSSFKWPGCLTANTRLVWMGAACPNDMGRISYTRLRAVDRTTGRIIMQNSRPCVLSADAARPAWTRQRFGGCGTAPMYAPSLPVMLCTATGGGGNLSPSPPPPSASPVPPSPPSPSPSSPSPDTATPEQQSPAPSPAVPVPARGPVLPRDPLQPGETAPSGIARIEAVIGGTVDRTNGMPIEQQATVGIMDSGIDSTHADLSYAGGSSWVTASTKTGDSADAGVDVYGHGTHVAGIVGARNNGAGIVGVVPGVPLYSLKVLDGEGRGSMSSVLDAVKWAAGPDGRAKGIRVINLSLAGYVDPSSADYQAAFDSVCSVMREASDSGLVIVAAAGNYGTNLRGYLPASCPTVAAVTSIDSSLSEPSGFSNWLPDDATPAELASVIAAPGSSIRSTISYTRDASGYRQLSGTSMASPHVAGVAAACVMSGACADAASGIAKFGVVKAAAEQRLAMPDGLKYGFTGDPAHRFPGKQYGHLVWAKY